MGHIIIGGKVRQKCSELIRIDVIYDSSSSRSRNHQPALALIRVIASFKDHTWHEKINKLLLFWERQPLSQTIEHDISKRREAGFGGSPPAI